MYNGRYTYFDAVTQNFTPYFDRGAVTVLSDELLGKPYIQGSLGQYSENESPYEIREVWYDPEAIWLTFDLRRPAVIEVYSEKDLTKSKWKDIATKSTLDGGAPYFGWGWQCKVKYSMKADTGKVEIPTLCVDNGMALTFVFDGYTEPADVNELEF